MYINHGFIKPFSTISIPVKIVEKFDNQIKIKLEINWCKPSKQMKDNNDSKMSSVEANQISKKIFEIKPRISQSKIAEKTNQSSES